MTKHNVQVFDEKTFYARFVTDLEDAKALVLIQSSYLSESRIDKLEHSIQSCVRRGVCVCTFVQEPRPDSNQYRAVSLGRERLRAMGVHVSSRELIHEKLAIIDDSILWDGSLNILSQVKSSERMTRWADKDMVLKALLKHGLDRCDVCRSFASQADARERVKMIGQSIAQRRRELNLSQADLARLTGLSQTVISNLECGRKNALLVNALMLCDALQLDFRPLPWHVLPSLGYRMNVRESAT